MWLIREGIAKLLQDFLSRFRLDQTLILFGFSNRYSTCGRINGELTHVRMKKKCWSEKAMSKERLGLLTFTFLNRYDLVINLVVIHHIITKNRHFYSSIDFFRWYPPGKRVRVQDKPI